MRSPHARARGLGKRGRRALLGALVVATILDGSFAAAEGWDLVEPMPTARTYHAAATTGDRWYVAGGLAFFGIGTGDRFPAEVDVYDPRSGHWTTIGSLTQGREYLPAILDLSNARVLFPGGFLPAGSSAYLALATCDISASVGTSPAPNLLGARNQHSAAFAAGKFIVTGGWGMGPTSSKLLDDAETWDGTSPAWTPAGTMPAGARSSHTTTTLQDGKQVLVVGGGLPDRAMNEVDLLDATTGTWSTAAPLKVGRTRHKAILLNDGRVLVAGGGTYPGAANNVLMSVELFDPRSGEWSPAASMTDPRFDFDMVLLPDGRVLVAGGSSNATDGEYGALRSAEVYDPAADAWTPLAPMHDRRRWPTLAVLSDGVYVAGGAYGETTVPNSALVLASVERLPWSALGITGPGEADGGVRDGSPPDSSDGTQDSAVGADAAIDVSTPSDAVVDATQEDGTGNRSEGDSGSDRHTSQEGRLLLRVERIGRRRVRAVRLRVRRVQLRASPSILTEGVSRTVAQTAPDSGLDNQPSAPITPKLAL